MKEYRNTYNVEYCQELENAITLYEKTIGHFASRTRNLIQNLGNIGALEKLMESHDLQRGFKILRDNDLLDKTFEATMIKFQNEISFKENAIKVAKFRYDNPRWDEGI